MTYQYSETNVMHFLFDLLRIKGLYMFRALLAYPQEGLHKQQLCILCACYVSWLHQDWSAQHPEDEQVMLETCRGPNS
jgi:hypothetical protein